MSNRTSVEIEYDGYKFFVLVSPGQIINKRKAYVREMKKRELSFV